MELKFHKKFIKDFQKLPFDIQQKLSELESLLREDIFHPLLHTKQLSGRLQHLYSFRITRDYRVIFQLPDHNFIELLAVKHRKEIYKKSL